MSSATRQLFVTFSGESSKGSSEPINNVLAVDPSNGKILAKVLPADGQELRGMAIGPDGDFYVAQAYKNASAVLRYSSPAGGSYPLALVSQFVTPAASSGLLHPYQPAFGGDGNLYVSSQDTNVVSAFYGPEATGGGDAMPDSAFLNQQYPDGTFHPGTFVAADAAADVPPNTSVPIAQGGLGYDDSGPHSVRGIAFDAAGNLYVADEAGDRVAVFDTTGTLLGALSGISEPVGLCFDPASGNLYIGSPGSQSIYVYATTSGTFEAQALVSGDKHLKKVSGLAVDASGKTLYSGDRDKNLIHVWKTKDGKYEGPLSSDAFTDSPEQLLMVNVDG